MHSRLITGSGKYHDDSIIKDVLEAAACDIITVAVRRVDFDRPGESVINHVPKGKILLPNTSGAVMQRRRSVLHVWPERWGVENG